MLSCWCSREGDTYSANPPRQSSSYIHLHLAFGYFNLHEESLVILPPHLNSYQSNCDELGSVRTQEQVMVGG